VAEHRIDFARAKAVEALRLLRLDTGALALAFVPTFEEQFGVPPRPAQAAIDAITPDPCGTVTVLEAPTGSGKTEAALRWATRLFADQKVGGIYFALPLRAAAVQRHTRLQDFLDHTFGTDRVEAVLAVPGYLRSGIGKGVPLPDFRVQWTDDPVFERRAMRWAVEHPKRLLAAPFAVGTVDQALLAVLAARHAHLRFAALTRNLLVVDEVHASDRFMERLIAELVTRFRELGGQVLLMSATLGSRSRSRYLSENPRRPAVAPPLERACAHPYPAITLPIGAVAVSSGNTEKRSDRDLLPSLTIPPQSPKKRNGISIGVPASPSSAIPWAKRSAPSSHWRRRSVPTIRPSSAVGAW